MFNVAHARHTLSYDGALHASDTVTKHWPEFGATALTLEDVLSQHLACTRPATAGLAY